MDHAFTDQMVRTDPSLREAAEKYLLDYKGSFQPILEARRVLMEGVYLLNVAEIRTVLNVMRADTSIRVEYTPPAGNVIQFPRQRVQFEEEPRVLEPQPKRPQQVVLHGRIKYVFGMSTHKRAEVIHYVSNPKSKFVFKASGARTLVRNMGWQQLWHDRIEIEVAWECSSKNPKIRFLTSEEVAALLTRDLMRICPGCLAMRTANA